MLTKRADSERPLKWIRLFSERENLPIKISTDASEDDATHDAGGARNCLSEERVSHLERDLEK